MIARENTAEIPTDRARLLFENDRIRAMEVTMHPGDSLPMHDHPDTFIYALTDIENIWTSPDGSEQEVMMKAGEAIWHEAVSHRVDSIGDQDQKVVIVELKR